jgi:LysM domain
MAAPPPAVGWVRVSSTDPPLSVTARLADERPDVGQGFGGWEAVERPRRKPLTYWKGQPGLQLTLPILLDRWSTGVSIEAAIERLQKMGQPTAADGEPPQVTIRATGGAVPFQGRTWVLGELSFGDALMNEDGNRVRQYATLTLWEYVEDVYLTERSAANRRRRKKRSRRHGAARKRIVAKRSGKPRKRASLRAVAQLELGEGEDLATIAARELGDADRWTEIAELNGLRDPRAISPGQVIRLP